MNIITPLVSCLRNRWLQSLVALVIITCRLQYVRSSSDVCPTWPSLRPSYRVFEQLIMDDRRGVMMVTSQLECDIDWYRYTSHGENHSTECDIDWYRYTSHSENHSTECDIDWYRYTSHSEHHSTECDMDWYRYIAHSENHYTECDIGW